MSIYRTIQSGQTYTKPPSLNDGVARHVFGWGSIANQNNDEPFYGDVLQIVETDNFWVLSRTGNPPPEPYGTDSFRFLDDGSSGCNVEDEGVYWDGSIWRIRTLVHLSENWSATYVKTSNTVSPFGFYELENVISGVPPSVVLVSEYFP
jgi:hypothetical protein